MSARRIEISSLIEGFFAVALASCLVAVWRVQQQEGVIGFFQRSFCYVEDRGVGLSLAALIFFLAWFGMRSRAWFSRRGAAGYLAKIGMLSLSLWIGFVVGERVFRSYLAETKGFNLFQDFNNFQDGKVVQANSNHGLAVISYLISNPILIYDIHPNQERSFGSEHLSTNRFGMRDREYSEEKPPGTLRIVGIGDSGMFGWGVEEEETFLSVLEQNLATSAKEKVEVLNLGVPGYNTRQEVEMLEVKGLRFEPDIVVVHWCSNDYMLPFFLYKQPDLERKDLSFLLTSIYNRKKFTELVRPVPVTYIDIDEEMVDPALLEFQGVEGVKKSLLRLLDLGDQHDFKVMMIGPMDDRVVELCNELGILFHSVYEDINLAKYPDKEYAIIQMHPTAPGHRVIGEHLETWLRDAGWVK